MPSTSVTVTTGSRTIASSPSLKCGKRGAIVVTSMPVTIKAAAQRIDACNDSVDDRPVTFGEETDAQIIHARNTMQSRFVKSTLLDGLWYYTPVRAANWPPATDRAHFLAGPLVEFHYGTSVATYCRTLYAWRSVVAFQERRRYRTRRHVADRCYRRSLARAVFAHRRGTAHRPATSCLERRVGSPPRHVTLVRNGRPEAVETRAATVADLLARIARRRAAEDALDADPNAPLADGGPFTFALPFP